MRRKWEIGQCENRNEEKDGKFEREEQEGRFRRMGVEWIK